MSCVILCLMFVMSSVCLSRICNSTFLTLKQIKISTLLSLKYDLNLYLISWYSWPLTSKVILDWIFSSIDLLRFKWTLWFLLFNWNLPNPLNYCYQWFWIWIISLWFFYISLIFMYFVFNNVMHVPPSYLE